MKIAFETPTLIMLTKYGCIFFQFYVSNYYNPCGSLPPDSASAVFENAIC